MTFHHQIHRRSRLFGVSVIGLLLIACGPSLGNAPPIVTLGQGHLGIVSFPEAWTKAAQPGEALRPGDRLVLSPEEFSLRKGRVPPKELILGAESTGESSDNHFAVSVDGRFEVRTVSQQEWNGAVETPHSKPPSALGPAESRVFPASGQIRVAALRSPTQRFVAVLSYTGIGDVGQGNFLGGGDYRQASVYLDVYDKSGRKVAAGSSQYSGGDYSGLLGIAMWIDDGVFIAPLDRVAQSCFLAILPAE